MAAYIAFIASLNLCIGYALGVYIGVLPGIPSRRDREEDHEEPLGLPVAEPPRSPAEPDPQPKPEPAPEKVTVEAPVEGAPAPEMDTAAEPDQPAIEVSSSEDSYRFILDGIAGFKQKLETVSGKLAEAKEDREAVDEFADEMKQANNAYLDQTSEAVESLNSADDKDLSATDESVRELLNKQTDDVRRANQEIDEILADIDTEVVRRKLMESNEQLLGSAAELAASIPETADNVNSAQATKDAEPANELSFGQKTEPDEVTKSNKRFIASETSEDDDEAAPVRSASDSLALMDELIKSIDEAIAEPVDNNPLQVATLSLQLDGDDELEHTQAMLQCVQDIVAKELGPGQRVTMTPDGDLLVTLPGDNVAEANERCERLRQQVKETTFCRADTNLYASLVCSLTDTNDAKDHGAVMSRLKECQDEALKLGESRTFHHDGALPVPVPPLTLAIDPQTVEF
ncbi:hypothetical protein NG895_24685 [Aeoliella sp. ICT_H6.2]|uniref:Uncharacterized protein n=1 Tax=Aeoliella straminimaris TaxID=2954799 RepID=A0A9X2FFL4_9BACT|nr:hypothetical protein [Aeoliella straminimaris]MCO6047107.1 hypothetical protein [Aeoliella straminimaris]